MGERAIDELKRFVRTQKAVLAALQARHGRTKVRSFVLPEIPSTGDIEAEGETWHYVRHGSGVRFRGTSSGRSIDVHDKLDCPDLFDPWRLQLYFGSIGRRGVKLLEEEIQTRGVSIERALTILLERWQASGEIIEEDGSCRLAARATTPNL